MYNYYLSNALVQLGHRVTIIASRWSKKPPFYENQSGIAVYRLLNRHFYRLHRLPLIGRYVRSILELVYSYRVARQLRQLMVSDKLDVVEFAEVRGEGFVYLKTKQRAAVVVRCHTPTFVLQDYRRAEEMAYDTSLTTQMEKFSIRRADALTAPSQDMAVTVSRSCEISTDRSHVIPNALDVRLFSSTKRNRSSSNDRVNILHVGRLDRVKGIEILAEAIPLVVQNAPSAHFIFIGQGKSWQKRLQTQFHERRMDDHVSLLGGVDQETLLNWYQQADIAVVPTLNYESFSYTCAQAMAARLPLVASRIGGIPETVGDRAGILVEPGNVEALVEALMTLIENPEMRQEMGRAGQKRAKELFAAEKVAREMVSVYQGLI